MLAAHQACSFILFIFLNTTYYTNNYVNKISCSFHFGRVKPSHHLLSFIRVSTLHDFQRQRLPFLGVSMLCDLATKEEEQAGFEPGPPGRRANVLPLDHGASCSNLFSSVQKLNSKKFGLWLGLDFRQYSQSLNTELVPISDSSIPKHCLDMERDPTV